MRPAAGKDSQLGKLTISSPPGRRPARLEPVDKGAESHTFELDTVRFKFAGLLRELETDRVKFTASLFPAGSGRAGRAGTREKLTTSDVVSSPRARARPARLEPTK